MKKPTLLDNLLSEKNTEKLLRKVHDVDPKQLIVWNRNSTKKFEALVVKVALLITKNRELVLKIQKEGDKHATV